VETAAASPAAKTGVGKVAANKNALIGVVVAAVVTVVPIIIGVVLTSNTNTNKDDAAYYNTRGIAYGKEGDYDRAIESFDVALSFNPNYAAAYHNRGNAYFNKGDYGRAIVDFTSALRINPNSEQTKDNLERAREMAKPQANTFFEEGLKYINEEGVKYVNGENYYAAIISFNNAIKLNPNVAEYYFYRALANYFTDSYAAAITDLTEAIKLEPDNAEYYARRGELYEAIGDTRNANADYATAKRLGYKE
jgi:tetratricopeptide (TPR) repeat protein